MIFSLCFSSPSLVAALPRIRTTNRAACVDIEQYLDIPSPMTGDLEINLDEVDTIECLEIEVPGETEANLLETVTVEGGTLTLKSSNNVRCEIMPFSRQTNSVYACTSRQALKKGVYMHDVREHVVGTQKNSPAVGAPRALCTLLPGHKRRPNTPNIERNNYPKT